ncbi:DJ-1/PfpI family protein [Sulfidibacter corallicola]|uniref:DJ-1/PfpI family protein n=1 Tax=Sulfidibacter corallicola TaxID=2818388 RepID=A0A8A4TVN2_SULCO|nr:DJ-1/PfpI family protein [Sulfidibacter corallicola]QTD54016.1 DJ-1/PfpI family protein [Sulfidibacter corallicola]
MTTRKSIGTALLLCLLGLGAAMPLPAGEKSTKGKTMTAVFVVVDGVYNTELTAPYDILQHTVYHSPAHYFRCVLVSPDGKPVTSAEGMRIEVDYSFANCPTPDVLIIPSTEHSMSRDLEDGPYMRWVRKQVPMAKVVMTLCDGAFPLAHTGVLKGMHATTYPGDQAKFAESYPDITVHREVWFVHHDKYITSVGGAKSFEPALYLAHRWFGEKAARGLARGLVIDWDLTKIPHKSFGTLPAKPKP